MTLLLIAAYHEAGHAVVAIACGRTFDHTSVMDFDGSHERYFSIAGDLRDRLRAGVALSDSEREAFEASVVTRWAGAASERLCGSWPLADPSGQDFRSLWNELHAACNEDLVHTVESGDELRDRAEAIVTQRRRAIDAVVAQLIAHDQLTYHEVAQIMETSSPAEASSEL